MLLCFAVQVEDSTPSFQEGGGRYRALQDERHFVGRGTGHMKHRSSGHSNRALRPTEGANMPGGISSSSKRFTNGILYEPMKLYLEIGLTGIRVVGLHTGDLREHPSRLAQQSVTAKLVYSGDECVPFVDKPFCSLPCLPERSISALKMLLRVLPVTNIPGVPSQRHEEVRPCADVTGVTHLRRTFRMVSRWTFRSSAH